jgi:hypothetical protein
MEDIGVDGRTIYAYLLNRMELGWEHFQVLLNAEINLRFP